MSAVPDDPQAFFSQYVPQRFSAVKDALAGKTSPGSICFRVLEAGAFSLSLQNGELKVEPEVKPDVVVQITLNQADFNVLVVETARQQEAEQLKPEQQLVALKAITMDAFKADQVRGIAGSVALVIQDGDHTRRVTITPGSQAANIEAPECKLSCHMSDILDWQAGKIQPMQLVMMGKMRIEGNAQIPMALSAVLA